MQIIFSFEEILRKIMILIKNDFVVNQSSIMLRFAYFCNYKKVLSYGLQKSKKK